jgi:carboxyl-terminal processing protease
MLASRGGSLFNGRQCPRAAQALVAAPRAAARNDEKTPMPRRNLLILLLAAIVSYACYVRGQQNPYARYVADGLAAIDEGSLEHVPRRDLFAAAMEGMVGALRQHGDEHSQYLPQEVADPLRIDIRQQFGGIGVRIGFEGEPPRLVIVGPPDPGTPADRANLLPGDTILAIDDRPTVGMTMTDVLSLMRGEPGSKLRLRIQQAHAARPRSVELVREVIHIESVLGDRRSEAGDWVFQLADEPRMAHIRIASFGDRTAMEFARAVEQVLGEGAAAVVLDLRDNAGGALDAAVAVCEMLLPAGKVIVETRGRGHSLRQRYATTTDGSYAALPLAVVVNQNSASAAEIVAASVQDHRRAIVVGERTYGKGTVQQLVPLESGRSLLKLTWANFWRPSGKKIHRAAGGGDEGTWGVVPDPGFERSLAPEEYAEYRKYRAERDLPAARLPTDETGRPPAAESFVDEPLQMAVDYLRGKLDQTIPRNR